MNTNSKKKINGMKIVTLGLYFYFINSKLDHNGFLKIKKVSKFEIVHFFHFNEFGFFSAMRSMPYSATDPQQSI